MVTLSADQGTRAQLLAEQLRPSGSFGVSTKGVCSTGNGSVAMVGWLQAQCERDSGSTFPGGGPSALRHVAELNVAPPLEVREKRPSIHSHCARVESVHARLPQFIISYVPVFPCQPN
eukprot:COSAG01_NODE_11176_length_1990_cov_1.029614_2_plen_118_part_00